jgi:DNA-binding transcriptional MerR regulator
MSMSGRYYSQRELAELARCSLGQLEYLREIRLLVPARRTGEGAFCYDDVNLLRLQQIRVGRARGLALEEIRRWLARDPSGSMLATRGSSALSPARACSALYVETEVKVETNEDRDAFKEEAAALYASLSARRRAGMEPVDERLQAWAERHCCHINRWFCPCDGERHVAFGRAIANNPYHCASIERHGRNLAAFMVSVLEAQTPYL